MSWHAFADELARRRDAGRPVQFWWRDDDAGAASPALRKLVLLSKTSRVPLALAVVPDDAEPGLFSLLHDGVSVLQHGTDHVNRAATGEKKTEYPPTEPIEAALLRLQQGSVRLRAEKHFVPVLVPPWNRMRGDLVKRLPAIGLCGLSQYGARASAEPVPGLRQVNTHVDIIAWREGKRFVGEAEALALAMRSLPCDEPIGWLTHHAVHDSAAWDFLERLLALDDVRWLSAAQAFSYTAPAHG